MGSENHFQVSCRKPWALHEDLSSVLNLPGASVYILILEGASRTAFEAGLQVFEKVRDTKKDSALKASTCELKHGVVLWV